MASTSSLQHYQYEQSSAITANTPRLVSAGSPNLRLGHLDQYHLGPSLDPGEICDQPTVILTGLSSDAAAALSMSASDVQQRREYAVKAYINNREAWNASSVHGRFSWLMYALGCHMHREGLQGLANDTAQRILEREVETREKMPQAEVDACIIHNFVDYLRSCAGNSSLTENHGLYGYVLDLGEHGMFMLLEHWDGDKNIGHVIIGPDNQPPVAAFLPDMHGDDVRSVRLMFAIGERAQRFLGTAVDYPDA